MSDTAKNDPPTSALPNKGTIVERAIAGASAGAMVGGIGGVGVAIAAAIVGAIANNGEVIREVFTHHGK